ncbi:MAG: small subunit ribosomal protein S8e [Candidatus Nanohaloarchaea archaeon]|jgi:small subunit ribosomal protein S8e
MAIWHKQSGRKKTGGRTRRNRKSKKHELGSEFSEPEKGEKRIEKKRTRGGNQKNAVKRAEDINLAVDGEVKNAEIESVEDNPANPNFVRRSLLTKGTIVQTSEGKARITSRPGQDGMINGELVED